MDSPEPIIKKQPRKLPVCWRYANFCYKCILALLTAVNFALVLLNNNDDITIPNLYFEILSTILAALPIAWSHILDNAKEACGDTTSSIASDSPPDSPAVKITAS